MVLWQLPESGRVLRGVPSSKACCGAAWARGAPSTLSHETAWLHAAWGAALGHRPGWNPNDSLLDCEGQERVKTPGSPTASRSLDLPRVSVSTHHHKCLKAKRGRPGRKKCQALVKRPLGPGTALLSETVTQA